MNLIIKPLLSLSILLLANVSTLSVGAVSAQNSSPPLAPSRLSRSGSIPTYSQTSVYSSNSPVLNGSVVSSGTAFGASRLLRQAVPVQMGIPAPAPAAVNQSLFSATEQAAFSQLPQPTATFSPVQRAPQAQSPVTAYSASASASGGGQGQSGKFDIGQALRLGAQFASAVNSSGFGNNNFHSPLQGNIPRNVLNSGLSQPSFVSKFARPLTAKELTTLSSYDVVIVLDKSGSMDEHDCPGGMSRWEWCQDQMMSLTAQVSSVFKSGITVALFSSDFDIYRNVDLNYINRIFGENGPSGGTYTGKVMDAVFQDYFSRKASNPSTRRLLVQVVTDGDPSDKGALIEAISRASQMIKSPGEITVNFLQIGHEEAGARTLAKLDNNMASEGARFDIVKVEPFSAVAQEGLPRALVDATN